MPARIVELKYIIKRTGYFEKYGNHCWKCDREMSGKVVTSGNSNRASKRYYCISCGKVLGLID